MSILSQFSPEQIIDGLNDHRQVLRWDPLIHPLSPKDRICGQIYVVVFDHKTSARPDVCPDRRSYLGKVPPNSVLLLHSLAGNERAIWGEIMTQIAMKMCQIQGVVTTGSVRDVEAISALNFPVFCAGYACENSSEYKIIALNEAIKIGSTMISPGDWIIGSQSGLVVVPQNCIDDVIFKASQKNDKETQIRKMILDPSSSLDDIIAQMKLK